LVTSFIVEGAADNTAYVSPAFVLSMRDPLTGIFWMFRLTAAWTIVAFIRWLVRRVRSRAPRET
jgi:flagellar biogenesis protein FliO